MLSIKRRNDFDILTFYTVFCLSKINEICLFNENKQRRYLQKL